MKNNKIMSKWTNHRTSKGTKKVYEMRPCRYIRYFEESSLRSFIQFFPCSVSMLSGCWFSEDGRQICILVYFGRVAWLVRQREDEQRARWHARWKWQVHVLRESRFRTPISRVDLTQACSVSPIQHLSLRISCPSANMPACQHTLHSIKSKTQSM